MASLFTGKYPTKTGVRKLRTKVPQHHTLLAELMQQNGYHTGSFVTNGNLSRAFCFDQGFKDFNELWKGPENGGQKDSYTADVVRTCPKWCCSTTLIC
jgi:arylsulfatase A-like enzyme